MSSGDQKADLASGALVAPLRQAAAAGAWSWSQPAVLPETPRSRPGLTVFKSVGSAALDLAAAEALLGAG